MDVLPHAEAANGGDFRRHLFAGQMPAHAGLGALADLDFDSIGLHEVFFSDAIFIGDVFKDKFFRSGLLLRYDAALAALLHAAGHGSGLGQGDFRFARQSAKGHMSYENGVFCNQRTLGVLAQNNGGAHLFLVQ